MSCLYSSPEVTIPMCLSFCVLASDRRSKSRFARSGTPYARAGRSAAQFLANMPCVAVNKDALPNSPTEAAGRIKSFRPPKQAQVSRVSFQAQFRLSFALRSEAAQLFKAIALK
jgi:hypothetical protein